jgi:hypothetical protein
MPLTLDEAPKANGTKVRWWSKVQSLQTVAFVVGWVVGIPAGALGTIAWQLSSTQITYASMQRAYVQVEARTHASMR